MPQVKAYVSSMDKRHVLTAMPAGAFTTADAQPDDNSIILDPARRGQPILGFGGNLMDTDVYNLLRMSPGEQDKVLELLFDPDKGAGWNFMRVPFGSSDWERNFDYYTYNDMPEGEKDWELAHFSVQKDIDRGFFELLRKIRRLYPQVEFLASVWGLPGWMKSNDSIMGGSFLPECTDVYARYLRMCVQAFAEQGIGLYAVTIQNEPKSSDFPNNNRGTPCTRFTWRLQRDVLIALRGEFNTHGIDTRIWPMTTTSIWSISLWTRFWPTRRPAPPSTE
jgi:glucosylceramidase